MNKIEFGDCRKTMRKWKEQGIKAQTCVTSPPYYGLRDYGHNGQIGLEESPEQYVANMVEVFACVWDVLEDDGTLWLNLGDSYSAGGRGGGQEGSIQQGNKGSITGEVFGTWKVQGFRPKNLLGIPWRVALALQDWGWNLRQDIIWNKPNPMPESVTDRCTKAHEYIFLMSKSQKYYYDHDAIKEEAHTTDNSDRNRDESRLNNTPGRTRMNGLTTNHYETKNKRSVWTVNTKPYEGAHFAVFPTDLIEPCILAGAPVGGIVLDPFMGSGTTAQVAQNLNRQYLGCELNPDYEPLQKKRLRQMSLEFV
jgi:DNA modification methylase